MKISSITCTPLAATPPRPVQFSIGTFSTFYAGLVEVRTDAQRRLYRLQPTPLREVEAWLEPYRRLWSMSLDRLEAHLDSMADRED